MSEKQLYILLEHLFSPTKDITEFSFSPSAMLHIKFFDNGRNWHSVGFTPDGIMHTFEV